eukprot:TRINITY_DN27905_c0_g1_i1.p1 TRINITY_DN27905_c0_g1~~TRINITY_DN27905_c0_g1_i1.p1  ORF type:complete len:133 (-),score=1.30 TRINITY_DN27905_c0_g1_i1:459-857(-)
MPTTVNWRRSLFPPFYCAVRGAQFEATLERRSSVPRCFCIVFGPALAVDPVNTPKLATTCQKGLETGRCLATSLFLPLPLVLKLIPCFSRCFRLQKPLSPRHIPFSLVPLVSEATQVQPVPEEREQGQETAR